MSDCVFFYGTLLPDFAPSSVRGLVSRLVAVAEGSVRGVLYDLGEYPGARLDESSLGRVFGHVFLLPDEAGFLEQLDAYEGFDPAAPELGLFVRKRHPVLLHGGAVIECWIYEYNGNPVGAPVIKSGRYGRENPGGAQ